MLKKNIAIVAMVSVLLLVPAFTGCLGTPSTKPSEVTTPINAIKIVPYVTVAYLDWNGYWDNGQTDTWFWLDIRNIGRSNQKYLQCYLDNLPSDWKLYEIHKACDLGNVELDWQTNQVKVIYAQHTVSDNNGFPVDEEWHNEFDTTLRLRFRVSCGQKGGWDLDGDGIMDTETYNENGVKVGTFASDNPYDFYFNISNDYCQANIKFQVYIIDREGFTVTNNYSHPYGY